VTLRFLEIAEIELDQAIHWYGAQAPGLGPAAATRPTFARAFVAG